MQELKKVHTKKKRVYENYRRTTTSQRNEASTKSFKEKQQNNKVDFCTIIEEEGETET